jgi:hypothetical protein
MYVSNPIVNIHMPLFHVTATWYNTCTVTNERNPKTATADCDIHCQPMRLLPLDRHDSRELCASHENFGHSVLSIGSIGELD